MAEYASSGPVIQSTRRYTFRRLGQMHGDHLTQLRNPPRAEAARPLLGQLEAHRAGMKKQLDLWFKEQNFVINKINRGQARVYKSFLKAHYDQKRLARIAAEKKHMEELKEASAKASFEAGEGTISERSHSRSDVLPETPPTQIALSEGLNPNTKLPAIVASGTLNDAENTDETDGKDIVMKKYNRHRSEFAVMANAPVAVPVIPPIPLSTVNIKPETEENIDSAYENARERRSPQRRVAKVLVVRKQTPDAARNTAMKESSVLSDTGRAAVSPEKSAVALGGVAREGSKSFIHERSGSIYIQTLTMANADIGEEAVEKAQRSDMKSPIEPLKPAKSLIRDPSLPVIPESKPKPEVNLANIPKPKPSEESPRRKPGGVRDTNYPLGELKIRVAKKKPAPPTSYTISVLEKEKDRLVMDGTTSRLAQSENITDRSSTPPKKGGKPASMTLAAYNRKCRKQRDTHMSEILNREPPILYERDDKGEIVKSIYDFKRREFKRPSSRAQKTRKKLLQKSRDAQKEEREKVIQYIDKLSEEERQERLEREQRARQKELDAAAARAEAKKLRAAETDPGVLLRSLIRAFRKGGPRGENEDPNSVRSLERCSYMRVYRPEERVGSAYKKSSWRQKTNVSNKFTR